MKVVTALAFVGAVSAFAPQEVGRPSTQQNALFDFVSGMDLFAPKKDQNDYGARGKKVLTRGKITKSSYVPDGLTATQYQKMRDGETAKKKSNYDRNVKKAGVFEDYTEFYIKRGTDNDQSWKKSATLGHRMAKTKYDYDDIETGKRGIPGQIAAKLQAKKAAKTVVLKAKAEPKAKAEAVKKVTLRKAPMKKEISMKETATPYKPKNFFDMLGDKLQKK